MTYLEAGIELLKMLEGNGFQGFFVGGFVRDYLLDKEANDIDIATNALPNQLANLFEIVNTGVKFNSVTILYKGYRFETTTYRLESTYHDNRHPTYEVADNLATDLRRRDFTINAMAMDKDLNVIDNYNGRNDLENKVIKTVYDPMRRFSEDALRMLRACYFAAKLDFEIEKETLQGMKSCSYLIQSLSNDRITWELEKIINTNNVEKGFTYLLISNILPYLLNYKKGISLLLENRFFDINWLEFLAISFYDNVYDLQFIHLKNTNYVDVKKVIEVSKSNPKNDFSKVVIFEYGLNIVLAANKINMLFNKSKDNKNKIEKDFNNLQIRSMSELAINAQDIIKLLNPKDNRIIGEILNKIKQLVLIGSLNNNKECIIKYIKKHY